MAEHDERRRSESTQTESRPWKPIETAPRDGTPVLVWNGRKIWKSSQRLDEHASGHHPVYGPGNGHEWYMAGETYRPTHWMPLPEPPTDT